MDRASVRQHVLDPPVRAYPALVALGGVRDLVDVLAGLPTGETGHLAGQLAQLEAVVGDRRVAALEAEVRLGVGKRSDSWPHLRLDAVGGICLVPLLAVDLDALERLGALRPPRAAAPLVLAE